jgi:hypothetical protein
MKVDWRTVSKWLLLIPTIAVSTITAYIFIESSLLLDRLAMRLASTLHINSAPTLILRPFTLLTVFLAFWSGCSRPRSWYVSPLGLDGSPAGNGVLWSHSFCDAQRPFYKGKDPMSDQGKVSLSGKTEKAHSPLLELISRARVSLCRQAREEAIPLFYSTNAFSSTMSVLSPRSQ